MFTTYTKKNFIKTFFLLSLPFSINAQTESPPPIQWSILTNTGIATSVSFGQQMQPLPDGGYVYSDGNIVDDNGQIISTLPALNTFYTLTSTSSTQYSFSDVKPTSDGGFIFTGGLRGNINDLDGNPVAVNNGTGTTYDILLVKYNSTNTIEWVKSYGGSGIETANRIIQTSDGGYLLTGQTRSADGDFTGIKNYGTVRNWFIIKTDSNGNEQWIKTYGTETETSAAFLQTAGEPLEILEGGEVKYIITGTITSTTATNGDVVNAKGGVDGWVIKLNSQGIIQAQKTLGGSTRDVFGHSSASGLLKVDDGYILFGTTNSIDGDVSEFNGGDAPGDAWIVKLSLDLQTIIWEKTIGGSDVDTVASNSYSSIAITPDGHIVTLVRTVSSELVGFQPLIGQTTQTSTNNSLVTKLNSLTGAVIWSKFLATTGPVYNNHTSTTITSGGAFSIFTKSNGSISVFISQRRQAPATVNGETEPVLPFSGPDVDPLFTEHNYTDTDTTVGWRVELAPCPLFTTAEPVALCEGEIYDFHGTEITEAGTYTHTVAGTGDACDEVVTVEVTVNPVPELTIATTEYTFCGKSIEQLLTAVAGENDTIQWYASEDAEESFHTGATYTTPELTTTTSYWVEATNEDTPCPSERIPITITIITAPDAPTAVDVYTATEGETIASLAQQVTAEGELTWYADELLTVELGTDVVLEDETTYYVTQTIGDCESLAKAIEVKVTLSTNDFDAGVFEYYPNPVNDKLYFGGSEKVESVQVYDLNGKLLFSHSAKSGQLSEIDLSGLATGTYVVKAQTGEQQRTFKVIKK